MIAINNTLQEITTRKVKIKSKDWGYEYKSKTRIFGLPLLHISFKWKNKEKPVPAFGIISIGQFGGGIINISQFGFGIINISQFGIGLFGLGQVTFAYSCISQIGIYIDQGYGQVVKKFSEIFFCNT